MLMKRILTLALCLCSASFISSAMPASDSPDEFNRHWFIQIQGGVAHTVGETSFDKLLSPSAALYAGYRFSPVWSIRAGLDGWQGAGADIFSADTYRFSYLQGGIDLTADICSMFSGYSRSRLLSPYLFAGVGVNAAFGNDEANSILKRGDYLWSGHHISPVGRFGAGTGIRLTDAVRLTVEAGANLLDDKFNSKRGGNVDWQLTARVGLAFSIGLRKARKTVSPDVPSAPVTVVREEPVRKEPEVRAEVHEEPAVVEKPAFAGHREEIYFVIGKTIVRDSEMEKIGRLVAVLNENPETKVSITGYADAATGYPSINLSLSRRRSESVASILESKGISADRIMVEYKGDTVQPNDTPETNRVAICIVD